MKYKTVATRVTDGFFKKLQEHADTYGVFGRKATVAEVLRQAAVEYLERHNPQYRVKLYLEVPRVNLDELTEEQLLEVMYAAATIKRLCGAEASELLEEVEQRLVAIRLNKGE